MTLAKLEITESNGQRVTIRFPNEAQDIVMYLLNWVNKLEAQIQDLQVNKADRR